MSHSDHCSFLGKLTVYLSFLIYRPLLIYLKLYKIYITFFFKGMRYILLLEKGFSTLKKHIYVPFLSKKIFS